MSEFQYELKLNVNQNQTTLDSMSADKMEVLNTLFCCLRKVGPKEMGMVQSNEAEDYHMYRGAVQPDIAFALICDEINKVIHVTDVWWPATIVTVDQV